ncbi:hypothetical protein TNCV_2760151 [Trichonephila clavipes]|nr:hypothetical protein TNCV_2760151 [Trichonephila clavipes]
MSGNMWLKDIMDIPIGCHCAIDQGHRPCVVSNGTQYHDTSVREVCRKAKTKLRRSPQGLHTQTGLSLLLTLNLDLLLKTTWFHSIAVQFHHQQHHFKWRRQWMGVIGSQWSKCRDTKCLIATTTWQQSCTVKKRNLNNSHKCHWKFFINQQLFNRAVENSLKNYFRT